MPASLELVAEGAAGMRHALGEGDVLIGRGPAADLRIDAPDVSRFHARVRVRDGVVDVEDLGSQNGTLVNGSRVTGRRTVHPGDRLQVGTVVLRLDRRQDAEAGAAAGVSFDVGRQSGSEIWNVGGNVHQSTTVVTDEPWDELFQGTVLGRIVMAVGLVVAVTGFGLWVHLIFTGFAPPAGADPFDWNPFTDAQVFGIPQAILGFGMFAVGGLVMALGSGASRAGRRRRGEMVRPVNTHVGRRRR